MGIIEDVVENAKTAAAFVGKKAEDLGNISKLKFTESHLSEEIKRKFQLLGQLTYDQALKESTEHDSKSWEIIEDLKRLHEELAAVRNIITGLKNKAVCKCCGKKLEKDAAFCSKCGGKVE